MDHITADKNVQDHQPHPHPATQMIAQVRLKRRIFHRRSHTIIFQWIALGTTGARGDPVQVHVVGVLRYVHEPKMDHLTADKSAQDHQPHPHPATQMSAQVRQK